jgi:hypothetical protein
MKIMPTVTLRCFAVIIMFIVSGIAAPALAEGEERPMPMPMALQYFNSVTVSDGSSLYTFTMDGTFHSRPQGNSLSGRTLDGRWTADNDGHIVVIARQGLANGISKGDDYRRIVFIITNIIKHRSSDISDAYFTIDEMTKISKPDNINF